MLHKGWGNGFDNVAALSFRNEEGRHSRGQRLEQVLPELQRHQVGEAAGRGRGGRERGRQTGSVKTGAGGVGRERRRGSLVSQMEGLCVWAAWHAEGSRPSV